MAARRTLRFHGSVRMWPSCWLVGDGASRRGLVKARTTVRVASWLYVTVLLLLVVLAAAAAAAAAAAVDVDAVLGLGLIAKAALGKGELVRSTSCCFGCSIVAKWCYDTTVVRRNLL